MVGIRYGLGSVAFARVEYSHRDTPSNKITRRMFGTEINTDAPVPACDQSHVIRRALHVSIDGVNPFQVVQATWNLLERSAAAALEEAKACGWGVIVKEALAPGSRAI